MIYVALLRGINVGGNKKVEMAKLKKVFEGLGFSGVSTYINSGNVIFEADEVEVVLIENALKQTFGFEIKVLVRDLKNIAKLCKAVPAEWSNDAQQKTDVLFLWDDFDSKASLELIKANPDVDTLKYVSGAIVWHVDREHYAQSGMRQFIGTTIYKNMTARNINTVRRLYELMSRMTD